MRKLDLRAVWNSRWAAAAIASPVGSPIAARIAAPILALTMLAALLLAGCSDDSDSSADGVEFVFQVRAVPGEAGQFTARTDDPDVIAAARAELALPVDERMQHISGPIARGHGGHNLGWSWHHVPSEWDLAVADIELCDGTPEMVEDDLDYWVDTVGSFCPWSSYVAGER